MFRWIALVMFAGAACAQAPFDCPVTPTPASGQTYGTPKLSVRMTPGPWAGLPIWPQGRRQKIVWYTEGFVFRESPNPALTITGRRLDGAAAPMVFTGANGSHTEDLGHFIMSGVIFPTKGCWEITGHLDGVDLSYVVEIN